MARRQSGKPAAPRAQRSPSEVEPVKGSAPVRICEGTRLEIEQHGKAVDPFTGRTVTRADVQ